MSLPDVGAEQGVQGALLGHGERSRGKSWLAPRQIVMRLGVLTRASAESPTLPRPELPTLMALGCSEDRATGSHRAWRAFLFISSLAGGAAVQRKKKN